MSAGHVMGGHGMIVGHGMEGHDMMSAGHVTGGHDMEAEEEDWCCWA